MSTHAHTASREVNERNRRKQHLINPRFQRKYALLTAVMVFVITSMLSSVLYGLLHHQARMRMMQPETYTAEVTLVILFFGVAFAGISSIGVGLWSVLVTHRFCGPLYVMERAMTILAQGRIPKLRNLRRKDEFKDFYATFSTSVYAIRDRRVADLQVLKEALATARGGVNGDDAERCKALETLIATLAELEASAELGVTESGSEFQTGTETDTDSTSAAPAFT